MEMQHKAYVKTINGTPFYFVKKFSVFPEYKNVPPILETYAMHSSFKKACAIAGVYDAEIQQQLLNKIEANAAACKIIPLQTPATKIYNLKRKHNYLPAFFKLIGLG